MMKMKKNKVIANKPTGSVSSITGGTSFEFISKAIFKLGFFRCVKCKGEFENKYKREDYQCLLCERKLKLEKLIE